MKEAQFQKELTFPDPTEPRFTLRAKDNLSGMAVSVYRDTLKFVGYPDDDPMVKSCDEFLARREEWRAENPDKCKNPDF